MSKESTVKKMVDELEKNKSAFLSSVENNIHDYIVKQKANCLTIVERSNNGNIYKIWKLKADRAYLKRLIRFCRNKKINGRELDSGLTDPIVNIVVNEYNKLYKKQSDQISEKLIQHIVSDKKMSTSLIEAIVEGQTSKKVQSKVKKRCVDLLIHQMSELITSTTFTSIKSSTINAISSTSAGVIAQKIILMIGKTLAVHLKIVIAKVLAAPIVKKLIIMAVKKFVIAALIAAFFKLIGVKLGISAGAVALIAILPLLVIWIAHDIKKFPNKLANKVSRKVRESLDSNYQSINTDIFGKIYEEIIGIGAEKLAKIVINDPNTKIGNEIEKLISKI